MGRLSPNLTTDTVDTTAVDTVDTMDTVILAKGLLMPNLRPKLPLLPNPKLRLNLTTDTDTLDTVDTMAIPTDMDTVMSARGPLMLNPKLRLNLTTDMDITDMVVDTTGVELPG